MGAVSFSHLLPFVAAQISVHSSGNVWLRLALRALRKKQPPFEGGEAPQLPLGAGTQPFNTV
jgi:hypothetical protein